MVLFAVALAFLSSAEAGDGPWSLRPGENNVYVAADYYRYGQYVNASGEPQALDSALTATGLKAVWTIGLVDAVEVELNVPFERVRANEPDSDFCNVDRPADWCTQTAELGDVLARGKIQFLNESYLKPFSAAWILGVRSGEAYSEKRGRLTTLGEGQTDLGSGLAAGRTGTMGHGWYRVGFEGWYWYRFPHAGTEWSDKVPADEVGGFAEVALAFSPRFAVGPVVSGFNRLGGVNVSELDFDAMDSWSSLDAAQVQVGGKVGIFPKEKGPVLSAAILRTIWARNNPSDTFALSLGLGWFIEAKEAPSSEGG